jgi:PiT family inorganic phosphate transporter
MDWFTVALLALVFLAVMLVAGNNLSACVGPTVGARVISKRFGVILGAVGFSSGLLVQGSSMTASVASLLPNATDALRIEALAVPVVIFLLAFKFRLPMSLSMALVGLLAGLSVAGKTLTNGVYIGGVVLTWIVIPFASLAFAFVTIKLLNRGSPKNFWRRLQAYKILLVVASFTTAYVTGANTIGIIVATGTFEPATIVVAIIAIFVGAFFLSQGAIKRVAEEFYLMRYTNAAVTLVTSTVLVELATFFNVPLSITQTTSTAVFGTGVSYKTKFVTAKPFLKEVAAWVIAPVLSFVIGLILGVA